MKYNFDYLANYREISDDVLTLIVDTSLFLKYLLVFLLKFLLVLGVIDF